jgi:hypothetical protein
MTEEGTPGRYVVSLSGGTASAVAAERAIARYGRDRVDLWFADTSWEDEDLYRFLAECVARWGGELITGRDGRTPLQVAEDKQLIPDNAHAPCARALKIEPLNRWLTTAPRPMTNLIGLDWREPHRVKRASERFDETLGVALDFPLLWKPYEYRPYSEVVRSWGIEPPRLYALGFPHNNCGGRCVKQGQAEWLRLKATFPERFAEVRDWEQEQRAKGGARANYSILRDRRGGDTKRLTLAELEARHAADPPDLLDLLASEDDRSACFCTDEVEDD